VIARIALLLGRRDYSIIFLALNPIDNSDIAEMDLKVKGSISKKEQIKEQLKKLVDVIDVKEKFSEAYPLNEKILSYN
jgi:acetolactate synthase small subunit